MQVVRDICRPTQIAVAAACQRPAVELRGYKCVRGRWRDAVCHRMRG